MNYEFPVITHIDEVKHLLEDRDDFRLYEKDDFDVIDYVVAFTDTFPPVTDWDTAVLREFRGLIFYKDGFIARRAYHKFFNVDEREETKSIDLDKKHVILEKLDGSMIAPFSLDDGSIYWATKVGAIDFHDEVAAFVTPSYVDMVSDCLPMNQPIFEWMGPNNRIVIGYDVPQLVLTGIRSKNSGEYMAYNEMKALAEYYGVPCVKAYDGTFENMEKLMTHTRGLTTEEGYVIVFEDGHRFKIKSDWYCQLHKVKSYFDYEKDVVKLIMQGDIDDLIPMLDENQQSKVNVFSQKLNDELYVNLYVGICSEVDRVEREKLDKKGFALSSKNVHHFVRSVMFKYFDDFGYIVDNINDIIKDGVINNTSSGRKWVDFKKANGITLDW